MSKYKVEFVRRGGGREYYRTIKVPRSFDGNIRDYIFHKLHMLLEPEPKYRHTEQAFNREWEILQYYKI